MKIVLFGDSITDMGRDRKFDTPDCSWSYGHGYPIFIAGDLYRHDPNKHQVINRGISGNRIVDLYARIKSDVWNLQPDLLSILIGVNDIWHELDFNNGVDVDRYEKVYRMLIEDTLKRFPNLKIILCEPFILKGKATEDTPEIPNKFEIFSQIYKYAEVVKKLAKEYNLFFLPLQQKFNEKAKQFGASALLDDGVHPTVAGATLIADEWLKLFKQEIDK